ncbi:MAG: LOG family protein [Bacteroidales bacterium]|nr:LOG family protein [Bacteroidales bacterium]
MQTLIDQLRTALSNRPYSCAPSGLYSAQTLYAGFNPSEPESMATCFDIQVYDHYMNTGKGRAESEEEALARVLHDHVIYQALCEFLDQYEKRKVVGIMGGHGISRTSDAFRDVVILSKQLTESGSLMISGGGPGAMEATHLGAWLAGRSMNDVEEALRMLSVAPAFTDPNWLSSAFNVINLFPQSEYRSLSIPTWLYGHEPSTPFATHIAKLFDNSIREDTILTVAYGGIVYTPGSAGTTQEIFQEITQNHYLSYGFSSPMIFMGKSFWTEEMPIFSILDHLVKKGKYKNLLLTLTDDINEVESVLMNFRNSEC